MRTGNEKLILLKKISRYDSKLRELEMENKRLKKELVARKRKNRDNGKICIRS